MSEKEILSLPLQQKIDHWLEKFPEDRKQSAVLMALRLAQESNGGYLNDDLIKGVAEYLGIPPISAFEVATFYTLYNHKPVGKYKISVCTNISCMLCGSSEIVSYLEKKLGIKMGQTSSDLKYTLEEVECLAACVGAPALQVNDKYYYENLSPGKIDQIIADLDYEDKIDGGL